MLTISQKVYDILRILGFDLDDQSFEASYADTWVKATLDEDEGWFERRSVKEIREAYVSWRKEC